MNAPQQMQWPLDADEANTLLEFVLTRLIEEDLSDGEGLTIAALTRLTGGDCAIALKDYIQKMRADIKAEAERMSGVGWAVLDNLTDEQREALKKIGVRFPQNKRPISKARQYPPIRPVNRD